MTGTEELPLIVVQIFVSNLAKRHENLYFAKGHTGYMIAVQILGKDVYAR